MPSRPNVRASRLGTTGASVNVATSAPPAVGDVLAADTLMDASWQPPLALLATNSPAAGKVLTGLTPTSASWEYPEAGGWTTGKGHIGEAVVASVAAPTDDFLFTIGARKVTKHLRSTMARVEEQIFYPDAFAGAALTGFNPFIRVNDNYLFVILDAGASLVIRRYDINNLATYLDTVIPTSDTAVGFQLGEGLGGIQFQDQLFLLTTSLTQATVHRYNHTTMTFSDATVLKDSSLVDFPVDVFGLETGYTGVGNTTGHLAISSKRDGSNDGISVTLFNWNGSNFVEYDTLTATLATDDGGLADNFFALYNKNYSGTDMNAYFAANDVRMFAWRSYTLLSASGYHRRNTTNPMKIMASVHGGLLGSTPTDLTKFAVFGVVHPTTGLAGGAICRLVLSGTNNFDDATVSFHPLPSLDDVQSMCVGPDGVLYVYSGLNALNTAVFLDGAVSGFGGWQKLVTLL